MSTRNKIIREIELRLGGQMVDVELDPVDGGADLDPDRLCHGDLVCRSARCARGNH